MMRKLLWVKPVLLCILGSIGVDIAPAQDEVNAITPDVQKASKLSASVVEVKARTGKTVKLPPTAPEFGEEHEFLEGATLASVYVQLDNIQKEDCKFGICLTAPIEVIISKHWWNAQRLSVAMLVSVWNPAEKTWIELRPLLMVDTLSITIPSQIPHKQKPLDLFDDLVDEQALLLKVQGLNSSTFFGFQRNKFQAHPIPDANTTCERRIPDWLINPKDAPSFQDVLEAAKVATQEWNAAATTFPMKSMKNKHGIPLKQARAIYGKFCGTVRAFDKSMESRPEGLSAKDYWRQRIIANLLHGGSGTLAQKALADGVSSPEIHWILANHLFRSGQLEKAKSQAQKAFELAPESELAYFLLKEISQFGGNAIDVNTSKLDAKDLAEIEERWEYIFEGRVGRHRVLPWKDVPPIYEATRKLEWSIPEDVPYIQSF